MSFESAAYEADVALKNLCAHVDEAVHTVKKMASSPGRHSVASATTLQGLAAQLEECAAQHVPDIKLRASEVEHGQLDIMEQTKSSRIKSSLESLHGQLLSAQRRCHQVGRLVGGWVGGLEAWLRRRQH